MLAPRALTLRLSALAARFGIVLWAVALTVTMSLLLARHVLTLPKPAAGSMEAALATLRTPDEQGRWLAVHVLYASCGCSQRVLAHLLDPLRASGAAEHVLWVGAASPALAELGRRDFHVTQLSAETLARTYHIEAAPLFLVADPHGAVRYAGGYTDRKQGADLRDLAILAGLARGEQPVVRPLFGCAVSQALQTSLDPFSRIADALFGPRSTTSR